MRKKNAKKRQFWPLGKTVGQGAATQVYLAVVPEVESYCGKFFSDCHIPRIWFSPKDDEKLARKLWVFTEKLIEKHDCKSN